jgi:hypothetical protein
LKNFNNQWVEIFAAGSHTDSEGRAHQINPSFLENVAANFNPKEHEAPVVVGHPAENAPAYGWTRELRVNGDRLEARFSDVDSEFEQMVEAGKFKKRSASFYVDANSAPGGKAPSLRHVGFLGALPPSVKGLKDIRFAEGKTLTFDGEINFSEDEMDKEKEDSLVDKITEKLKAIFGEKKPAESGAHNFTEADVKKLVEDSVKASNVTFAEEIKTLKQENATLKQAVDKQGSSATHDQNIAFVEKLGPAKCPPAFKAIGVVEFMDQLAQLGDRKVTVISFEEKDGAKKEIKTESDMLAWFRSFLEAQGPFIQFGERFGGLQATGTDIASVVPPERVAELREKAGLPPAATTAK